jgi:hypothetical protein
VTVDDLAVKQINFQNFMYSGLKRRPASASIAQDDIMIEVMAECESCKIVRGWKLRRVEFL